MPTTYRAGQGGGGVGRLTAQKSAAQKKKAEKKSSPGVLSRVMDVLSRGQYASAGMALGKGPGESLSYAWQGLQGKRKDSYSDVLSQRLGVKGKPAALLGFGSDILLDPTTYVGFGLGKTALQAGGKVVGKEIVKETVEAGAKKAGKKAGEKTYVSSGAKAILEARKLEKAAEEAVPAVAKKKGGSTLYKPPTPVAKPKPKGGAALAVKTADDLDADAAALFAQAKKTKDLKQRAALNQQGTKTKNLAKQARDAGIISVPKAAPAAEKTLGQLAFEKLPPEVFDSKMNVVKAAAPKSGATLAQTGVKLAPEAAQGAVKVTEAAAPKVVGAADNALPVRPTGRALEFKVMGKTIARSEKGYNAAAKVLRPLGQSNVGNLMGRTFRTGHGLPQQIRNIERKSQGVGMQDLHDKLIDIKTTFSGTTKAQRREIASAIDTGNLDALDDTLRPLAEYAQRNLDSLNPKEGLGKAKSKAEADTLDSLPSKSDDIADRLAKEYDKTITKQAYKNFREEVDRRFPDAARDSEIRKALDRTEKVFAPQSVEGREWTNMFDKIQGYWKMAVTAPNPGFHIRNMMGDSYLNYLDGVVSVVPYQKAAAIIANKSTKMKVAGKVLNQDDIMALYRREGLHSKFAQTENLVGGTSSKVLDTIGELSNKREDFGRLAHFIDALGKEARHGRNFDDAVEAAAERVRKFNIDYSDMTDMERKFKRVMPFYTFARKALPVQLEMLFTRPGRVAVLPKGKQAIERLIGVREEGDQSPLPGIDENLPPWMKDYFNISMGNNRVRSPDLPVDLLGQYANPVKGVLSGVTPFIKGPIELGTRKTVPEGFAQKASIPRYLLNQTPITRQVANYAWGDDDAVEKTGRWAVGPIASKLVSGPPARKSTKKAGSSRSKSTNGSGGYRAGS